MLVVSTPSIARAKVYDSITQITIGTSAHGISAYIAPPEGTAKRVIHNIPNTYDEETITRSLVNSRNPTILQARRLGTTHSVIIAFDHGELVNPVRVNAVTRLRNRPRRRHHPARDSNRLWLPKPIPEDLLHGTAVLRPATRAQIAQARARGVVKRLEKRVSDVEAQLPGSTKRRGPRSWTRGPQRRPHLR
ncbi:hypothetical protein HPB48_014120 [Haemaphysalis longicornis]|uniref:Uncharacterized protein n=1 Tax=Haemaphysalis longicornis TaxID=44386 RepID=A0A9J6FJ60_HAELO|nr:hypothetical protein HPB48_014120 [Haemaphysalis longicornis]